MKKTVSVSLAFLMVALLFCSCGKQSVDEGSLWADAVYTEDTELGKGGKTVTVSVTAEEKTVVFTINTDSATLGAALLENNLVEGETSEYGLFISKIDGISADYETDGAYWAFMQNGQMLEYGVDGAELSGGESYELVYTAA